MCLYQFASIFKCYFLRKAHSSEETTFTRVTLSGTHFSADSTEAIRIKCLAQGRNILMQSGFEPSIAVSRNRQLSHMTNML